MARSKVRQSVGEIEREIKRKVLEKEQARITEAVDDLAEEMRDYAVSISPEYSGKYKRSFKIRKGRRGGLPTRKLVNTDDIANLVEYGSIHNAEHAVMARTAHQFGGTPD